MVFKKFWEEGVRVAKREGWGGEYEDVGSDEPFGLASMHTIGQTHVEHVGAFVDFYDRSCLNLNSLNA